MIVEGQQSVEREIKNVLAKHRYELQGYQIYLFGSRARQANGPLSDFDLGVMGPRSLDLSVFYAIEDSLEEIPTLLQIDWVDLNRASQKLAENALKEGRLLYEG